MRVNHPNNKDERTPFKECSIDEFIVNQVYNLFFNSKIGKKTKKGILINRKDARLLLANKIRVDKEVFDIIISTMVNKGIMKKGNQGIYLKYIG